MTAEETGDRAHVVDDALLAEFRADFLRAASADDPSALSDLLDRLPGGAALLALHADGSARLAAASTNFARLLQMPLKKLYRIDPLVLLPREEAETLIETAAKAVATGKPESLTLHRPGQRGMRSYLVTLSRLSDAEAAPARLAVAVADVTERRRTQFVARQAAELLRAITDGVREYAVFMLNPHRRIVAWNAGAARLTGMPSGAVIGRQIAVLNGPGVMADDQIDWSATVSQAAAEGHAHAEGWLIRPDGMFWGTLTVSTMQHEGSVRGYAAVIHDMTESLASAAATRESETRFRDFAESASDWFWETDRDLFLTHVSATFSQRLGVSADFLIGKAHYQFSDMSENPDDWWDHLRRLNGHKPFRDFRYILTLPDGRRVHVNDSGKPLFDEKGRFMGYRGAGRDVSEQVETRKAAERLERRFFAAMDNASNGIALFDRDGHLVLLNRRCREMFPDFVFGIRTRAPYPALIRLIARDCAFKGNLNPQTTFRAFTANGPGRLPNQQLVQLADGRYIDVDERMTDDGGAMVTMTDVTELQDQEQQLRQAYKLEALGQLTGGVAHDFNNLLTVVRGNLEMLAPKLEDTPVLHRRIDAALEAVNRGADLTQRLLGFARRQPTQAQVVDLSVRLNGVVPLVRQALGNRVGMVSQIRRVGLAAIDTAQMDNAILNLCINARDAMANGGTVTLSAETAAEPPAEAAHAGEDGPVAAPFGWALIKIADTGAGMSPAVRERAFDPFFTTKDQGGGTGLGLSMVYGFVKRSGGAIDIESAEGVGTTVRLWLPLADPAYRAADDVAEEGEVPAGDETVLVVEDNAGAREVLVSLLTELGYTVLEAADAASALVIASGPGAPAYLDLLLTDYALPNGATGLEVAELLRESWPTLPVVVMTGFADAMPKLDQGPFAGTPVIHKPYGTGKLARAVRNAIDAAMGA